MEHAWGATQAQQVSEASNRSANAREPTVSVVGPPRRMRQDFSWWRLGRRQRGEWRNHGSGKRQRQRRRHRETILKAKGTSLKSAAKGDTGLATVAGRPNANTWTWRWRQREKATKAKARRKERACIMQEPTRRMRRRTPRTTKKEESERRVKEPLTMRGGLVR